TLINHPTSTLISCFYFSSYFFFYYYGDHRDLHSFPTRRLPIFAATTDKITASAVVGKVNFSGRLLSKLHQERRRPARLGGAPKRSEEHTSELQSRGHLVCRLLLEKKKKKK